MIGYAPNGYRLWEKSRRKIIISRDVIIEEKNAEEQEQTIEDGTIVKLLENQEKGNNGTESEQITIEDEEQEKEAEEKIREEEENRQSRKENNSEQQIPWIRRSNRKRQPPERYNTALLTYDQALSGSDRDHWLEAINEEKEAIRKNNTWTVMEASKVTEAKPLSSRWVLKVKDDGRYRARLVIKGCEQLKGLDFEEVYSPVVSNVSLRILFAIAASKNLYIMSLDIKTAFLHGELKETIYIYPPQGYEDKGKLFKLKKAIYGLKQAPISWNEKFSTLLKEKNLTPLKSDRCLFKRKNSDLMLAIYVDDGLLVGSDENEMEALLKELENKFEMTINRHPRTFLGMELHQTEEGIWLNQRCYAAKVLDRYGMENCNPVSTPLIK